MPLFSKDFCVGMVERPVSAYETTCYMPNCRPDCRRTAEKSAIFEGHFGMASFVFMHIPASNRDIFVCQSGMRRPYQNVGTRTPR